MNAHRCPTCGQPTREPVTPEHLDPVAQLVRDFQETCDYNKYVVRAGRVSEGVAAKLLDIPKRTLANLRRSGKGPEFSRYAIEGSQYAYSLRELADYQATKDEDTKWY